MHSGSILHGKTNETVTVFDAKAENAYNNPIWDFFVKINEPIINGNIIFFSWYKLIFKFYESVLRQKEV
jgi:hypothetical protein